jgi:hypothetical protein
VAEVSSTNKGYIIDRSQGKVMSQAFSTLFSTHFYLLSTPLNLFSSLLTSYQPAGITPLRRAACARLAPGKKTRFSIGFEHAAWAIHF